MLQRLDGGDAVTMSFVSGRFPADGGGGGVVAVDSAGLVLLQPQSSRRELLVPAPRGVEFLQPQMLPDGRHVLFSSMRGSPTRARILSLDLRSRQVDTLLDEAACVRSSPMAGSISAARTEPCTAIDFDPVKARTRGTVVPTGDVTLIARTGRVRVRRGCGAPGLRPAAGQPGA